VAETPFVSVVIPVLDDLPGLRRCLEALEGQSYPRARFEVIVVDNGSRPAVRSSLPAAAGRTILEEAQPGSYRARNRGVQAAAGEILAFTDADCVPDRDWLAAGVRRLAGATRTLVAGGIEIFYADAARPTLTEQYDRKVHLDQKRYAEELHFGATANLFAPAEAPRREGGFLDRLHSCGDLEWGRRLHARGWQVLYVPEALVRHPARRRLGAMLRKARRIARGLHDIGEPLGTPTASLRRFRAVWGKVASDGELSLLRKAGILAVAAAVQSAMFAERVRARLVLRNGCAGPAEKL
jgi:glycosyltransferase involved in cell wall biosynthesis